MPLGSRAKSPVFSGFPDPHIRTTSQDSYQFPVAQMWYASCMPNVLPQRDLEGAEAAVAFAAEVRRYHRRRTHPCSEQRLRDIARAQERLAEAMRPLKSAIGAFHYGPQTTIAEQNRQIILDASKALQSERRKIWKMQQTAKRKAA